MTSLLTADDISKTFTNGDKVFTAVKNVSLRVEHGESVGLIGESGSGKTTVARMIAGLSDITKGSVYYDGFDLSDKKAGKSARKTMQMVFQNPHGSFSPRMKIGRGIREGLAYLSDLSIKEQDKRVDEVMESVGLPLSYKKKYVFEISGGEAQRAAIARAISIKPKLLLCDEITSALDVKVQGQLVDLLSDLRDNMNMAILFISHDIKLVRDFCSRVYVMKSGEVVEEGKTKELFDSPQNDYTRKLLDAAYLKIDFANGVML